MSLLKAAQILAPTASTGNKLFLLIGQCVPSVKQNVSKIKVKRLELDENLNMYFKTQEFYHAVDPGKKCRPGDIVLIQELPEKITKLITHRVLEIVHTFGDITDPVTGEKVVVGRYRHEIEKDMDRFGRTNTAFDYEKAPPRGTQDGKRDFTSKETYLKYHVFPEEDPYAL